MPALCRMAVEAAARDIVMGRRYGRGAGRPEVEEAWQEALTTGQRVALALRDDKDARLTEWIAARPRRRRGFEAVTRRVHLDGATRWDPLGAIADVRCLIDDLRADAR